MVNTSSNTVIINLKNVLKESERSRGRDLEGFIIPVEEVNVNPSITLDSFDRFYISAGAREVLKVRPMDRIAFAYNPSKKILAVVVSNLKSFTSDYISSLDSRYYAKASYFVRYFGLKRKDATPRYFDYVGEASVRGVYLFKLRD